MSDPRKFITIPKPIKVGVFQLAYPFQDWVKHLVDTDQQFNRDMGAAIVGAELIKQLKEVKSSIWSLDAKDQWKPLRDAAYNPTKGAPVLSVIDEASGAVKAQIQTSMGDFIPYFQAIDLALNTDPRGSRAAGSAAKPRKLIRKR